MSVNDPTATWQLLVDALRARDGPTAGAIIQAYVQAADESVSTEHALELLIYGAHRSAVILRRTSNTSGLNVEQLDDDASRTAFILINCAFFDDQTMFAEMLSIYLAKHDETDGAPGAYGRLVGALVQTFTALEDGDHLRRK